MLAAVDFDDHPRSMACKVDNVSTEANLATKMCSLKFEPMPQMPPQLPFGLGRRRTKFAGTEA